MKYMRLIFMGTPEFAVPSLQRLIRDGHEIAAVFTQPDKPAGRGNKVHEPPVKTLAVQAGIRVHQPSKIKTNEEVRRIFEEAAPDTCIVAAYGKILPGWLLTIPRLGCINVHSSLLPKYRGAAPINWAIARGEHRTGVTIMHMDEGMDTGPIVTQSAIEIEPDEAAPQLTARLAELGADLLARTLPLVDRGEISATTQNESEATYAPMLKREDGLINFADSAKRISDRLRGFQPWPGAYATFRGARLIIWSARPVPNGETALQDDPEKLAPGMIDRTDKTGLSVVCGEASRLYINELQIEGKRRLSGREFVNGMRLTVGDTITD